MGTSHSFRCPPDAALAQRWGSRTEPTPSLASVGAKSLLPTDEGSRLTADSPRLTFRLAVQVAHWQILLKKSLLADERNFSGPLVRPPRGDVRDHVDSPESDQRLSYPFYGAVQPRSYLEVRVREKFGVARFSTFSTVSALS
jgi:hypothetical protein